MKSEFNKRTSENRWKWFGQIFGCTKCSQWSKNNSSSVE